jgi:hypothetical protein
MAILAAAAALGTGAAFAAAACGEDRGEVRFEEGTGTGRTGTAGSTTAPATEAETAATEAQTAATEAETAETEAETETAP